MSEDETKKNAYIICETIKYAQKLRKVKMPENIKVIMLDNYARDLKERIQSVV